MTPDPNQAPIPVPEPDDIHAITYVISPHATGAALLTQACKIIESDHEAGALILDRIITEAPGSAESGFAYLTQASLKHKEGDLEGAQERFSRMLEVVSRIADREPFSAAELLLRHSEFEKEDIGLEAARSSVGLALQVIERNIQHSNYSQEQHEETFRSLADILESAQDWGTLEKIAEKTLRAVDREGGDRADLVKAVAHTRLARVDWAKDDIDGAGLHLTECVDLLRVRSDVASPESLASAEIYLAMLNFVALRRGQADENLYLALRVISPAEVSGLAKDFISGWQVGTSGRVVISTGLHDAFTREVMELGIQGKPFKDLSNSELAVAEAFCDTWAMRARSAQTHGDTVSAVRMFGELAAYLDIVAPKSDRAATAHTHHGEECFRSDDFEGACAAYNLALEATEECFGAAHERTGEAYYDLGVSLSKCGDPNSAIEALKKSLEIAEGFGDAHAKLARVHSVMGTVCRQLGDQLLAYKHGKAAVDLAESCGLSSEPIFIDYLLDHAENTFEYAQPRDKPVRMEDAWRTCQRALALQAECEAGESSLESLFRADLLAAKMARLMPHHSELRVDYLEDAEQLLRDLADPENLSTAQKYISVALNAYDAGELAFASRCLKQAFLGIKGRESEEEAVDDVINLVIGTASVLSAEVKAEQEGTASDDLRRAIAMGSSATELMDEEEVERHFDQVLQAQQLGGIRRERKLNLSMMVDSAEQMVASLDGSIGERRHKLSSMCDVLEMATEVLGHTVLAGRLEKLRSAVT